LKDRSPGVIIGLELAGHWVRSRTAGGGAALDDERYQLIGILFGHRSTAHTNRPATDHASTTALAAHKATNTMAPSQVRATLLTVGPLSGIGTSE